MRRLKFLLLSLSLSLSVAILGQLGTFIFRPQWQWIFYIYFFYRWRNNGFFLDDDHQRKIKIKIEKYILVRLGLNWMNLDRNPHTIQQTSNEKKKERKNEPNGSIFGQDDQCYLCQNMGGRKMKIMDPSSITHTAMIGHHYHYELFFDSLFLVSFHSTIFSLWWLFSLLWQKKSLVENLFDIFPFLL